MVGRPSKYSDDLADFICSELADGKSLRAICAQDGMPCRITVFKWLRENPAFSSQYARARDAQADLYAEEIVEIADTAADKEDAPAKKLRVDARIWIASKLKPKVYGNRLTQEVSGPDGGPIQIKGGGVSALLKAATEQDGADEG